MKNIRKRVVLRSVWCTLSCHLYVNQEDNRPLDWALWYSWGDFHLLGCLSLYYCIQDPTSVIALIDHTCGWCMMKSPFHVFGTSENVPRSIHHSYSYYHQPLIKHYRINILPTTKPLVLNEPLGYDLFNGIVWKYANNHTPLYSPRLFSQTTNILKLCL